MYNTGILRRKKKAAVMSPRGQNHLIHMHNQLLYVQGAIKQTAK